MHEEGSVIIFTISIKLDVIGYMSSCQSQSKVIVVTFLSVIGSVFISFAVTTLKVYLSLLIMNRKGCAMASLIDLHYDIQRLCQEVYDWSITE